VIKIKRLRFVNNEPIALVTTYLPYKICPSLLKENLTTDRFMVSWKKNMLLESLMAAVPWKQYQQIDKQPHCWE